MYRHILAFLPKDFPLRPVKKVEYSENGGNPLKMGKSLEKSPDCVIITKEEANRVRPVFKNTSGGITHG
ncbi:MAG: hypothetical protein SOY32_07520 [Candidatus Faecousia sp.]|nr:hypothetical protein [Clostridiales bacterium]MDD7653063.1 hypothetical protein [Bacillota bacterium]MDY4220250.1 hypothetical protein [Candidatus Faecousia sp.]